MNKVDVSNNLVSDVNSYAEIVTRVGDGSYMNRLVCRWNEKVAGPDLKDLRHHIYLAGIDANGRVYLDCRKRLIVVKILLSTIVRPLHGAVKTLYHLSMIPVAQAIFSACRREISVKEASIKSAKSIVDIIRTPVYEVAMIIVGLAGLLIAPFAPATLYKCREYIAKIETALFGQQFHSFTLTPCFQSTPLKELIMEFGIQEKQNLSFLKNFDDTDYGKDSVENLIKENIVESIPNEVFCKVKNVKSLSLSQQAILQEALIKRAIIHFGRTMIQKRRRDYSPFYQIFGSLSSVGTYISAASSKTQIPAAGSSTS